MMKMKNNSYKKYFGLIAFCIFLQWNLQGQEDSVPIVRKPFISLRYFNIQNQSQYLILHCLLKIDKKTEPIQKLGARIYLDDETDENNLMATVITNAEGKANVVIPDAFKDRWLASDQHKFIAVTDSISGIGERQTEAEITIARLMLDTVMDAESRELKVSLEEKKDTQWTPIKDVEIKLGIRRLNSILSLADEETVTTDSTGTAIAEFIRDSMPGDQAGNLILVARVEDHELYGNLEFETSAPWGLPFSYTSNFHERSLWATGDRLPLWLLFIACFIIFSVWGTLIYLIYCFFRIRKLGIHNQFTGNRNQ